MNLQREIELYLQKSHMPPTNFGRLAANDPRFVGDLQRGRTVGDRLRKRVQHWMQENAL